MAKITRPDITRGASGQGLGVSGRVPTSGAGIGDVAANLANSVASGGVAEAVSGLSNQYFQGLESSRKVFNAANYSNAMTNATHALAQAYTARTQSPVDEDGNPTFEYLTQDLAKAGQEIRTEFGKSIRDPEARLKFETDFNKALSVKMIQGFSVARKQHIDYANTNLSNGIDTTIKQALDDSPAAINTYTDRVNELVDAQVDSGLLSFEVGDRLKDTAQSEIRVGHFRNLIRQDPFTAIHELDRPLSELGISFNEKERLTKLAADSAEDLLDAQQEAEDAAAKEVRQQQDLFYKAIDLGIAEGTAGRQEVEEAFQNNQITQEKYIALRKTIANKTEAKIKKREVDTDLSAAINEGKSLGEFSNKDIADHYTDRIDSLNQARAESESEPLTLLDKAREARDYKGPVKPFTREAEFSLEFGSPEESATAYRALEYLDQEGVLGEKGLSKKAMAIYSIAKTYIQGTNVPEAQALTLAKENIKANDTSAQRDLRNKFNRDKDFKGDKLTTLISSGIFDAKDGIFGGKILEPTAPEMLRPLIREAYIDTGGNTEAALNVVKQQIGGLFGESKVNEKSGLIDDKEMIMFLPPEAAYSLDGDTLKQIFHADIASVLPEGVDPSKARVRSDIVTRTHLDTRPTWAVNYIDANGRDIPLLNENGSLFRWEVTQADIEKIQPKSEQAPKGTADDLVAKRREIFDRQNELASQGFSEEEIVDIIQAEGGDISSITGNEANISRARVEALNSVIRRDPNIGAPTSSAGLNAHREKLRRSSAEERLKNKKPALGDVWSEYSRALSEGGDDGE